MDPVIISIFIIGVVVTIVLPPLLTKNSSHKKQFEQMDGRKLIEAHIHAGMLKGRLRLMAYLLPLPILILVRNFVKQEIQTVIIGLAFVVIFVCLSAAQFFGEIEKLITAEMENRERGESERSST